MDAQDDDGVTPVMVAARLNTHSVMDMLLTAKTPSNLSLVDNQGIGVIRALVSV